MKTCRFNLLLSMLLLASVCSPASAADDASQGDSFASLVAMEPFSPVPGTGSEPWTESQVSEAFSDQDQRIARLEAELESMRRSLDRNSRTSPAAVFSPPCSVCNRLYGAVEVTYLRPRVSGAYPGLTSGNGGQLITNHFDAGTRFILGYRDEQGFGVRGRYWSFDDSFNFVPPFPSTQPVLTINTQAADLEVTQLQHMGHWDLEVAGGVRYSKFGYQSSVAGAFGAGEASFKGFGPTLAVDARRPIGQSGFSLVGNVRGSLMFGEIRNSAMLPNMPRGPIRDEVAQSIENQLGVAWTQPVFGNRQIDLRVAWEIQYWLNDTLADDTFGMGSNLGFMGPTFAAEFRY